MKEDRKIYYYGQSRTGESLVFPKTLKRERDHVFNSRPVVVALVVILGILSVGGLFVWAAVR